MKNKDEKICSIPKDLWELILKNDYVGDILDIVEMGGAEELKTFLKTHYPKYEWNNGDIRLSSEPTESHGK